MKKICVIIPCYNEAQRLEWRSSGNSWVEKNVLIFVS